MMIRLIIKFRLNDNVICIIDEKEFTAHSECELCFDINDYMTQNLRKKGYQTHMVDFKILEYEIVT